VKRIHGWRPEILGNLLKLNCCKPAHQNDFLPFLHPDLHQGYIVSHEAPSNLD
jgi:hypothetical protein